MKKIVYVPGWSAVAAYALMLFAFSGLSYADDDSDGSSIKICYFSSYFEKGETKEFDTQAKADEWKAKHPSTSYKSGECSDDDEDEAKVCHFPNDEYEPADEREVRQGTEARWKEVYPNDKLGECEDEDKAKKICHFANGTSAPAVTKEIRKSKWSDWHAANPDDHEGECSDNEKAGGSWETVDSSSAETNADCVAFTNVVSSETTLKAYEEEVVVKVKERKNEEADKRKDEESKVAEALDDGDSDAVAEHQAKKDDYESKESEYKKSEDDHEDKKGEHEAKAKLFSSDDGGVKVPAGATVCRTSDGTLGFIPPTPSDTTVASPTAKALREVFGQ